MAKETVGKFFQEIAANKEIQAKIIATILGVRMDDMCKFPFSVPNILK